MTLNWVCAVLSTMGLQEPQIPDLSILELKVYISTPRLTLDPMDVLPITVRWTNPSSSPVKTSLFKITWLESPVGHIVRSRDFHEGCGLRWPKEIGPGQFLELTHYISLSFLHRRDTDAKGFVPPQVGEWKLWVEHEHSLGKVNSNVLSLTLKEDPQRSPEVRRLFGSEAWHRFFLGGGVDKETHTSFRRFVLSKESAPQKDLMAYSLGVRDFNDSRLGHALTMFGLADFGISGNVRPQVLTELVVQCHGQLANDEECIRVIDRLRLDERDVAFRKWTDIRKRIQERIDQRRAAGR